MKPNCPKHLALAITGVLLTMAGPSGHADVVITGPWWSNPASAAPLNGPHLDRPDTWFWFSAGGVGSFSDIQASGDFQIDSFLSEAGTPLDHALLEGVSYAAISSAYQFTSFTFSAEGGAVFAAQPVPEPGTWVLFALGLGVTGWLQKRRKP